MTKLSVFHFSDKKSLAPEPQFSKEKNRAIVIENQVIYQNLTSSL